MYCEGSDVGFHGAFDDTEVGFADAEIVLDRNRYRNMGISRA